MADAGHRETHHDLTQHLTTETAECQAVPVSNDEARRSSEMNRTFGKLFALAVIASVFAVACGNSPSAAKKTIIGDILYNNDAYQTAQQKQMQAYADSLGIQIFFENQLVVGTNAPNLS